MDELMIILVWAVIWSIVCYLIGDKKGRGTDGAILGFFLGLIGLIILMFLKPLDKK